MLPRPFDRCPGGLSPATLEKMEAPLTERVARRVLNVSFAEVRGPREPSGAGHTRFRVDTPIVDAGGVTAGTLSVGDQSASGLSLRAARLLPDVAALALIEAAAAEGRVAAHEAVNALTTLSWYAWLLERDASRARRPALLRELSAEARRIRLGTAVG